jgi:hypothetical protein
MITITNEDTIDLIAQYQDIDLFGNYIKPKALISTQRIAANPPNRVRSLYYRTKRYR